MPCLKSNGHPRAGPTSSVPNVSIMGPGRSAAGAGQCSGYRYRLRPMLCRLRFSILHQDSTHFPFMIWSDMSMSCCRGADNTPNQRTRLLPLTPMC